MLCSPSRDTSFPPHSSLPSSVGICSKTPSGCLKPPTVPSSLCTAPHTHIPMLKLNLWIRHSRRVTVTTTANRTIMKTCCDKGCVNVVSPSLPASPGRIRTAEVAASRACALGPLLSKTSVPAPKTSELAAGMAADHRRAGPGHGEGGEGCFPSRLQEGTKRRQVPPRHPERRSLELPHCFFF